MAEKEIVHIVPHTHWDREWYMPFEQHRFRLVELMDSLMDTMERDAEFKYFHLDGQMIVLEDYLEIKPHMRDRLLALIRQGRIRVGPWYILQDEYLTSDEANVRNMMMGLRLGEELGVPVERTGYLPDSFGNISQMPQILRGCGIDTVVFGRGVTNMAEVQWEAPDGSRVLGGHFTPWYNNAAELPVERTAAGARGSKLLGAFRGASKTREYLGMNGGDHQPVQTDLPRALRAMNAAADQGVRFVLSNLSEYFDALRPDMDRYPVIREELAGQNTNGFGLLISTASSRIYLKQKNHAAQNALERRAEPLGAMAYLVSGEYPGDFLNYAWKTLLKNHAHDSICGCGLDEVHREMLPRFEKVLQVSDSIVKRALETLSEKLPVRPGLGVPVAVFNTTIYPRSGLVTAEVDLPETADTEDLVITDRSGTALAAPLEVLPHTFTYRLPRDSFRKVTYVKRCRFRFAARDVPAFGCGIYYVTSRPVKPRELRHTGRAAENRWVSLYIEDNGSLTVTDKATGRVWRDLNLYEDTADVGDEYLYRGNGAPAVTSEDSRAGIALKEAGRDHVTFRVSHTLYLSTGYDRVSGAYSQEKAPFRIETDVTLTSFSRSIGIFVEMRNASGCHRLRAVFRNGIRTRTVLASGQFDILEREIRTRPAWTWPTNEQRMQSFAALRDRENALVVATRGLHEYEVLRDGSNTLCVNLLRCVDQMGDWGVFSTPDAQCLGVNTAAYTLRVGPADDLDGAEREAYQYASGDMVAAQLDPSAAGSAGEGCTARSLFSVEGAGVWSTALKKWEAGDGLILRLYNTRGEENRIVLHTDAPVRAWRETDLLERPVTEPAPVDGGIPLTFAPKQIKTLLMTL